MVTLEEREVRVQQIVDRLARRHNAYVEVLDGDRAYKYSFAHRDGRFVLRGRETEVGAVLMVGMCSLRLPIKGGWTLRICRNETLDEVRRSAAELAKKLAEVLPERGSRPEPAYPRDPEGGGTSGSAELGIPVSWLRKTQN